MADPQVVDDHDVVELVRLLHGVPPDGTLDLPEVLRRDQVPLLEARGGAEVGLRPEEAQGPEEAPVVEAEEEGPPAAEASQRTAVRS